MKSFAGIGMRDDYPDDVQQKVNKTIFYAAYALALKGFELRSGHADGTDMRFEQAYQQAIANGASGEMSIYLPSSSFNGARANGKEYINASALNDSILTGQHEYTKSLHPYPAGLRKSIKLKDGQPPLSDLHAFTFPEKLMARNANQILGSDLQSPVNFVICAALGSKFDDNGDLSDTKGGTGQAVRIAYKHKIEVFNLLHPPHLERIIAFAKAEQQKMRNPNLNNDGLTLG